MSYVYRAEDMDESAISSDSESPRVICQLPSSRDDACRMSNL